MKINEILILERNKRNMTQRALALKSNVSNATISRIESGEVIPDISTLEKLSKALNVDVNYLLGQVQNNTSNILFSDKTVVAIGHGRDREIYELSDEDAAFVQDFINKYIKNKPQ